LVDKSTKTQVTIEEPKHLAEQGKKQTVSHLRFYINLACSLQVFLLMSFSRISFCNNH
jgi:hypothetical protein